MPDSLSKGESAGSADLNFLQSDVNIFLITGAGDQSLDLEPEL